MVTYYIWNGLTSLPEAVSKKSIQLFKEHFDKINVILEEFYILNEDAECSPITKEVNKIYDHQEHNEQNDPCTLSKCSIHYGKEDSTI